MSPTLVAIALLLAGQANSAERSEMLGKMLTTGNLVETERQLEMELKSKSDDAVRMTLGMTKFLRAIEDHGRTMRKFGLMHDRSGVGAGRLPFFRIPVPAHPKPAVVRAVDLRNMLDKLVKDLDAAEAVLAPIQNADWKVVVQVENIKLNVADAGEEPVILSVGEILNLGGFAPRNDRGQTAMKVVVAFDKSDTIWLRGYCRFLQSLAEIILAYDARELFDHSAQIVFPQTDSKYPFLRGSADQDRTRDAFLFADAIAFIHMIQLPVQEPERLKSAHGHLLEMFDNSGKMWEAVLAETDSDREWIPSPKQTGAIPGVRVSAEMVAGWRDFVTEVKDLLEGKRLVPFWRDDAAQREKRGINIKRVFFEPRKFDLVLWIQGTAAIPYLEEGTTTRPETWARFQRVFQGEFITFFIWWN